MGCGREDSGDDCGKKIYHDCDIFVVDTIIVDWRFEEMGVLLEPVRRLE